MPHREILSCEALGAQPRCCGCKCADGGASCRRDRVWILQQRLHQQCEGSKDGPRRSSSTREHGAQSADDRATQGDTLSGHEGAREIRKRQVSPAQRAATRGSVQQPAEKTSEHSDGGVACSIIDASSSAVLGVHLNSHAGFASKAPKSLQPRANSSRAAVRGAPNGRGTHRRTQ